jgi:hypothetical protein
MSENEFKIWQQKVNELKKLPIFNMSLSSIELFHSNFIVWILETYPEKMAKFFDNNATSKITNIQREKKNIDISFIIGDTLYLIENKVKSIAYKEQLDKYAEYKIGDFITHKDKQSLNKIKYILLSLKESTFFENNSYITTNDADWEYKSYEYLIIFLAKLNILDTYHKSLIDDYCTFVKNLKNNIVDKINEVNIASLYTKGTPENKMLLILTDLRMHDFFQKGVFENFAYKLKNTLDTQDINISHGMTKSGFVDIEVNISEHFFMGIQIQGNQYRKYILLKSTNNRKFIVEKALELEKDGYFKDYKDSKDMLPNNKPNKELSKKYETSLSFNKYDTSKYLFLYKYLDKNLKENDEELIDRIQKDIQSIKEISIKSL